MSFLLGVILGVLTLIGYGAYRALGSDGWDDSNLLNWLRLLSQVFIHPEDFGKMYYLDAGELETLSLTSQRPHPRKPFAYIANDEFEGNFPWARP